MDFVWFCPSQSEQCVFIIVCLSNPFFWVKNLYNLQINQGWTLLNLFSHRIEVFIVIWVYFYTLGWINKEIHYSLNDSAKPWILIMLCPSTSFLKPQWFSLCCLCSCVFLPVWKVPVLLILWCFLSQAVSSFILWKRQKYQSKRN